MNKKLFHRGFTLIELLVVIAIIGILAAVVIGSLNDARSGGQNASIKQSVANVRTQAEVHYNANSYTYAAVCADTDITNLLTAAVRVSQGPTATYVAVADGTAAPTTNAVCRDNGTAYAAAAPLIGGGYWCVDSTGSSEQTTASVAANTFVCP